LAQSEAGLGRSDDGTTGSRVGMKTDENWQENSFIFVSIFLAERGSGSKKNRTEIG